MGEMATEARKGLKELAEDLLNDVGMFGSASNLTPANERDFKTNIIQRAQAIIDKLEDTPRERAMNDCIKVGEMTAKQLFNAWGVFQKIPVQGSISYKELASSVGCELQLLVRLAWMLNSTGILEQVGEDGVAHTEKSKMFINDNPDGDLTRIVFVHGMVAYAQLEKYFDSYGLQEPSGRTHVPYTFAYGQPEKNVWEVSLQNPDDKRIFLRSMKAMGMLLPVCGVYDFSWISDAAHSGPTDRPLFVDVGGGSGHAMRIICKNYGIPLDRCVLQDLDTVISEVSESQDSIGLLGTKLMAIDFHKEQPVKGALVYYIRYCLHNYSDDLVVEILKAIADAMAPDSKLLIAEQITPNPPSAHTAAIDLLMLSVGGKERPKDVWKDVLTKAGLGRIKFWTSPSNPHGIIECFKTI
ncbi:O-methyltransferase [Colletotrichum orchidophilum]|uniref:O-methyltransferase n=1 Tax=Colletotrichum orchidophilum TaxID=1209926 RepID=A0A1G4B0W8_9PEZI|nr:O-methyltransferase [Colletotrichum orchidophilum]OHE94952.1 O-methyltransferase [Colletotrichum orchidophilum]